MRRVLSILFLILAAVTVAFAQGKPPNIIMRDFSGGINSKWSPFLIADNEMLACNNYMLNLEVGALVLRQGDIKRTDSLDVIVTNVTPGIPALNQTGVITSVDSSIGGGNDLRIYDLVVDDTNAVQATGFWDGETAFLLPDSTTTALIDFYAKIGATTYRLGIVSTSLKFTDDDAVTMGLAGTAGSADTLEVGSGGITGLYALYQKPRTKNLLAVLPGFGTNRERWSRLQSSLTNKYQPEVFLADFIGKGATPIWETWQGLAYVAIDGQRPIVTNVTNTSRLVPLAPGQSEIVPSDPGLDSVYWGKAFDGVADTFMQRDTTAFGLVGGSSSCCDSVIGNVYDQNGTYFYTTYSRPFFSGAVNVSPDSIVDSLYNRSGYVSHKVSLFNKNAVLVNATAQVNDSVSTDKADSVIIVFARTRGYLNDIKPDVDSFFWIHYLVTNDLNVLDTFKLIDSIPDDSLGNRNFPFLGAPRGILQIDTSFVDSVYDLNNIATSQDRHLSYTAPGMPKFVGRTVADPGSNWWPLHPDTITENREHRGWSYMYTVVDTILLGLFSDSSANLVISTGFSAALGGTDSTSSITINVPSLPLRETNKVRVVWRAEWKFQAAPDSFIFITDTIFVKANYRLTGFQISGTPVPTSSIPQGSEFVSSFWLPQNRGDRNLAVVIRTPSAGDSNLVQTGFFPVGIIRDPTEVQFIDSLSWKSWLGGGKRDNSIRVDDRWIPTDNRMDIVKGFHAFKDNMFAWTDSRLFRSDLGDPRFKPYNDILFDPENGDVITQVTDIGPNLLVFWSSGLVELFDPVATLPTKGAPLEGIGCVAPNSLVNFGGTVFFRAKDGIRTISSSPLKNFGVANTVISAKINDRIVDGISDSIATTMVVAVDELNGVIIWCYPSIDTMFVYYPALARNGVGPWTTRSGSFFQATHYDTTTVAQIIKSSSLLYSKTNDQRVFEMFGSDNAFDSGVGGSYAGRVLTRPLFADYQSWEITKLAFRNTISTRDASVFIFNDSLFNPIGVPILLTLSEATFQMIHIRPMKASSYWTLDFRGGVDIGASDTDIDTIREISVWGTPVGEVFTK